MALTLKKVIDGFLKWAELALKPNTVKAYRHQLRKFVACVRNKQVKSLRPSHLTSWGKSWHEYQAVIRAFNWAVHEAKLVRKNPFAGLRMPYRDQRQRILSPTEIAGFLRACSSSGRQFLIAMRESFARPQEIRAAQWDDLQSEDPSIGIEQALAEGRALIVLRDYKDRARRKDASRPRVLLVSRRLGRLLLRLIEKGAEREGHIFLNSKGKPWTNNAVRCLLRRLRRRLGIVADKHGETIVAYTFRHSCATLAAASGVVDRVLADVLGHVETRTTTRYQHLNVGHLREALDRMHANRSTARKKAVPAL